MSLGQARCSCYPHSEIVSREYLNVNFEKADIKKERKETGELTKWSGVLIILAEDLGLVSTTYIFASNSIP